MQKVSLNKGTTREEEKKQGRKWRWKNSDLTEVRNSRNRL
jgi:hypothetical protein